MLIGIDASRALRARRTGTENYSLQLIRHLLALDSGHRFRLYCDRPPAPGLFTIDSARKQAELRIIPFPRLWTHLRLSLEVTLHPPDVLFVPSHVLPILHPRPGVVTVHDLGYRHFPEAHRRPDRWYLDLSTRFNARSAAHILVDSQATKADLARAYRVDPARVSVVYLGSDESLTPAAPQAQSEVLARLGIRQPGSRTPYILTVGTLQPRKNLERLVEAFDQIQRSISGLKLVLAGRRGWLSESIFQKVAALDLKDHVRFPGFVAGEDLPALLSGAALFAYPSLYEGFGLPILEAQRCGAPVLASTASSLPEVAGDAALLVDPLDVDAIAAGLHRLLIDEALRDRLRAAGFANVRRFSWQRAARETLAVLERVGKGNVESEMGE